MFDIEKYKQISDEELLHMSTETILQIEDDEWRSWLFRRQLLAGQVLAMKEMAERYEEEPEPGLLYLFMDWLDAKHTQILSLWEKIRAFIREDTAYCSEADLLLLCAGVFFLSQWVPRILSRILSAIAGF